MKRRQETPSSPEREELERQLESLRLDVRRLQLEHDLLMKANELIKKETGIDLQVLTNREKTLLAAALRQACSLSELLEALGLPRSSYFYHRARMQVVEKYTEVGCAMADIFERNHRCYGYRRMRASLIQAACASVREGGAALDEAGVPSRRQAETASIRFLPRGNHSIAGKPPQPRLQGCCSE